MSLLSSKPSYLTSSKKMDYLVLLYYCYTPIENPEQFREEHHRLCLRLNLLVREQRLKHPEHHRGQEQK